MVKRRKWAVVAAVAALALVAAACGDDDDDGTDGAGGGTTGAELTGDIFVSGSSTVEPVSARVADLFSEENPHVPTNVEGPGTGDGFEFFSNGETDVSDAPRPI